MLADLRRTDLALIDPASRHANGHYDWSTPFAAGVLGGTRPGALDWVVIDGPPAWFLGQGWALSPEIAGVSERRRQGAVARRRGRAGCGEPGAEAPGDRRPQPWWARARPPSASRCGSAISVVDTWDVAANPGFFVRSLTLAGSAVATAGFRTGAVRR